MGTGRRRAALALDQVARSVRAGAQPERPARQQPDSGNQEHTDVKGRCSSPVLPLHHSLRTSILMESATTEPKTPMPSPSMEKLGSWKLPSGSCTSP